MQIAVCQLVGEQFARNLRRQLFAAILSQVRLQSVLMSVSVFSTP
jgi:hypothetical protein